MPRSNARHIIVKDGKPAKSTKPRTVKTSKQAHRPFTLTNPVIMKETGEIDDVFTRKVIEELWAMHDAMVKNEEHYYNDGFLRILEEYEKIDDPKRARGKKNSALRGIIDKPAVDIPDPSHKYNFMEMLRTNVGSKIQVYITRSQLQEIISEDPFRKPREMREEYISRFGKDDAPSVSAIKKHVSAFKKAGHVDSTASASGLLPLSACDGHYRKLDADSDYSWIFLTFKLACGNPTLVFKKPKNRKRYSDGKVTAPTLRFDEDNHVIYYDFTLQQTRPKKKKIDEMSGVIGIDCGIVNTITTTYVGRDLTYSQPLFASGRIVNIENQIKGLFDEIDTLETKAELCDAYGCFDKAGVLYNDAKSKRGKISRLKKQKSVLAASEAVSTALAMDSGIAVEDLTWAPESHWDCSAFQTALAELAADVGLPVVKVNASGTSRRCPHCGAELIEKSGRMLYCPECDCTVDRDVIGSRGVGLRGLGYDIGDMRFFKYRLFSLGSRSDRHLRVDRARRYKSSAGTSQVPCPVPDIEACVCADSS